MGVQPMTSRLRKTGFYWRASLAVIVAVSLFVRDVSGQDGLWKASSTQVPIYGGVSVT